MKQQYIILSCIVLTTSLAYGSNDVVLTAKSEGYTAFHDAVMQAGLYEHAKKDVGEKHSMAPFTVFVPTNEAFTALKDVPADQQKKLITFHVIPGKKIEKPAEEMASGVPTVGEQLLFMKDEKIFLDESESKASIVKGPIAAKNGVIYIIDHVIAPAGTTLPSTAQPAAPQQATQTTTAAPVKPIETKASDDEEKEEAPTAVKPAHPELAPQTAQPAAIAQQAIAPMQFIPVPVPSVPQANTLTEQTGQILASSVAQLTQSIQLLIHVIQQAQQQVGTPSQAEAVPLTVIP